ncbi:hypothetical protein Cgig2_007407 [Carnegiea gigantea]|uniref:Mechanosensitive ion channel MscS domain-containing protein n=1 Tax=Carnegiea gigantea TaxID=171969 RepID=A0A9Q1KYA6_9CARY|nr:hypothetical protein Cgig2_007407 [Carnegiea gigantea]
MTVRLILLFRGLWCGRPEQCKGPKCTFYYLQGLRRSITFIAVVLMHLLTWNAYFRPRLGKSAVADKVLDFGASTFVSGLLCGVLLLIKNFVLLSWKAHTIYERSNEELIRKLTQWYCLYSLGLVRCRMAQDLDQLRTATPGDDHQRGHFTFGLLRRWFLVDNQQKYKDIKLVRQIMKWEEAKQAIIEVVLRKEHVVESASSIHSELQGEVARDVIISMHEKEILARTFVYGERSLPNDQDIFSFCQQWRQKYNMDNDPDFGQREISQEDVKKSIEDAGQVSEIGDDNLKDAEQILYKQLQETNKTTQTTVCAQDFETWMERAQQNCLQLRYFLASAEEVVKFLNRLMVGFIVVLVIITWLLLTKVLPTKVIVVVTSPILAAAFIFGDALKTMFQGIVFAYFMHPFTVGDLCIIDHIQMEVKQIGIWRTTFSKVGTEEEVLYPNSVLASQAIVNLDGNLLLHDFVEFSLHYDTKGIAIKSLEDSIKRCINPERSGSEPDAHAEIQESDTSDRYEPSSDDENVVVTKQVQDNIKITVHFMHDKNILDMTHAEAFNEKLRRKSEILQEVANRVSEYRRSLVKDQGD